MLFLYVLYFHRLKLDVSRLTDNPIHTGSHPSTVNNVTDMGTQMCLDPGGNGAIMNAGGEGGPGPPGGGRSEQLILGSEDG
jgi:hypothetical protein